MSIRHFSRAHGFAGHYNLYRKGIVHGNISPDNILLGKEGAAVDSRGVLVDLDHAKHVSRGRTHEDIWHENTQTSSANAHPKQSC